MAKRVDLSGRVVAVTGGGRGIGAAICRAAAGAGAAVASGDIDEDTAAAVAADIGTRASGHHLDVTSPPSFAAFLDAAEAAHGPVDTLVNNAGIMLLGRFVDESDAARRRQMDVNFHGVAIGMRLALPKMVARGRGLVVNVASGASRNPIAGAATYSASKHAVAGLTEAVRDELEGSGVHLALLLPAAVATDLFAGVPDLPTLPTLSPGQVADAAVAVMANPRFETFVPRSLGVQTRFGPLLPRRLKDAARRFGGADRVYLQASPQSRAGYERRAYFQQQRTPPEES